MAEWFVRIREEPMPDGEPGWHLALVEDSPGARSLGQVLVRERTGERVPRHWFHLGTVVHAAPELHLFRRQASLVLGNDLTGAAELHGMRCDSADPRVPRALVQAAVVWLAQRATSATREGNPGPGPRVFAELPGVRDADGGSPFWQGLGQHCLHLAPAQAERRFGPQWTRELAALLPRQPLFACLLADAAQAALSRPASDAAGWALALHAEGLCAGQHVTIFDAGPVHEAVLSALPAARTATWCSVQPAVAPATTSCWVHAEGEMVLRPVQAAVRGDALLVPPQTLAGLGWPSGARVWVGRGEDAPAA